MDYNLILVPHAGKNSKNKCTLFKNMVFCIKRYTEDFTFQEQIEWAVQEGADFILGETYGFGDEAMCALDCIQKYGNGKHRTYLGLYHVQRNVYRFWRYPCDQLSSYSIVSGLPAVINIIPSQNGATYEGHKLEDVCKRLEDAGAAAVGLNCSFGPATIVDPMKKVREACKV